MPIITNMQQDSSMLNWFPKIKDILPVPRTEILQVTNEEVYKIVGLLDGINLPRDLHERLNDCAEMIGYPLFLRTDQGSAKHDYERSCYLSSKEDLLGHLACLIEWHLMRDLWPQAIVFRELLPLNASFTAFHGLPIAKERRYFVDDGQVMCHHPYWPHDAIEEYIDHTLPLDWKVLLQELNKEDTKEIEQLSDMAEIFAANVPGFYSVDFAQKADGQWVLIDAARGELSWHPAHDEA